VVEYGLFNELDRTEGCFEAGLYSLDMAAARRQEYIAQGEDPEDITVEELCPDHEGLAKNGCEECQIIQERLDDEDDETE
jgi:hypothetical protein